MNRDRERARHLMMARLDGEISEAEVGELEGLLAADDELRAEWQRLSALEEVTGKMGYSEPHSETWETYWVSVYNKLERGIGWVLVSAGAIALIGFGLWEGLGSLWSDPSVPLVVKFGVFASLLGGAVLLVSVLRERLFTRRGERYDEVQR